MKLFVFLWIFQIFSWFFFLVLDSFYSFFICLSRERQQDTWNKLDNNWRKGVQGKTNSFFWLIFCTVQFTLPFLKYFKYRMKLLFFVDFSDFFMIFLDAIERQRTRNTNGNYFLKILQHLSDVVVEQRRFFGFFWWIFLFFSSDCICFLFRFVF
jgi:hypothetical protein